MTDDERAAQISKILATWGPVDKEMAAAIGLSDYYVEAEDILWAMEAHGYSAKKAVSSVLKDAFMIDLDNTKLDHYVGEIAAVLTKK
jgi:hypothetical protein